MNIINQLLELANNPNVKSFEITDWISQANSDNEFTSFSHLPIIKVELRDSTS